MIALALAACSDGPPPLLPASSVAEAQPLRNVPASPIGADEFREGLGGLDCADLALGSGPAATEGSVVVVDYTAWTDDGEPLESTWRRAHPYRFVVGGGRMIEGLDQGVRGMRPGGVRELRIPAELAFGDDAWTVDLELVEVQAPPTEVASAPARPVGELAVADLIVGDGPEADEDSTVVVDQVVFGPDGEAVDSSWTRAEPFRLHLAVARLGPALVGMRAGGRRAVDVPSGVFLAGTGEQPVFAADRPLQIQVDLHEVE